MTFLQHLEAKGRMEEKKLIAQNLSKQGFTRELISQITGLSHSEIEALLKK